MRGLAAGLAAALWVAVAVCGPMDEIKKDIIASTDKIVQPAVKKAGGADGEQSLKISHDHTLREGNGDNLPYKGVDYLGTGYDLLYGNPHGDPDSMLDPGFRVPVVKLHWDQGNDYISRDVRDLQPMEGFAMPEHACHKATTSKQQSSLSEYESSLSTEASVEASGGGWGVEASFSASAGFDSFSSEVAEKNSERFEMTSYCYTSWVGLKKGPKAGIKPTAYFASRAAELSNVPADACHRDMYRCVHLEHTAPGSKSAVVFTATHKESKDRGKGKDFKEGTSSWTVITKPAKQAINSSTSLQEGNAYWSWDPKYHTMTHQESGLSLGAVRLQNSEDEAAAKKEGHAVVAGHILGLKDTYGGNIADFQNKEAADKIAVEDRWSWDEHSKVLFLTVMVDEDKAPKEAKDAQHAHQLEAEATAKEEGGEVAVATEYEYKFVKDKLSWDEHEKKAVQWGGHLASPASDAENQKIYELASPAGGRVWLGGSKKAGAGASKATSGAETWAWSDSSSWSYTKFSAGEPNSVGQGYAVLMWQHGNPAEWDDQPKTTAESAVYKRVKPDPPKKKVPVRLALAVTGQGKAGLVHWKETLGSPEGDKKSDAKQTDAANDDNGQGEGDDDATNDVPQTATLAIQRLPKKSFGDWATFFKEFGTHYVSELHLGGKMIYTCTMTSEAVEKIEQTGISASMAVAASGGFGGVSGSASASASMSKNDKARNAISNAEKEEKVVVVGGTPSEAGGMDDEAFGQWAASVPENPMPIKYKLLPVFMIGDWNKKGAKHVLSEETYGLMMDLYVRGVIKAREEKHAVNLANANAAKLLPGQSLASGEFLKDTKTKTVAKLHENGELNIVDKFNNVLWSSGVRRDTTKGPFRLTYQTDANLVLYDANGGVLWASNTQNTQCGNKNPGEVVLREGSLQIISEHDGLIWSSMSTKGGNPHRAEDVNWKCGHNKCLGHCVVLYQHAHLKGHARGFGPGNYDVHSLTNDDLSSIKVTKGCRATIYEHHAYTGQSAHFYQTSWYVGNHWNDKASSLRVKGCTWN